MKETLTSKKTILTLLIIGVLLTAGSMMTIQINNGQAAVNEDIELKDASPGQTSDARPVKAMVLTKSKQSEQRTFPALIHVDREVKLAFRVGGTLSAVNASMGQKFEKGEILAQLDPRDHKLNVIRLKAAIEEANAGLKAMQTGARAEDISILESNLSAGRYALEKEKINLDRNQQLNRKQLIPKKTYDQSVVAFENAKAQVNASEQSLKKAESGARQEDVDAAKARIKRLKADLKAAEYALSDTKLVAPFTGFINETFVENFESVGPGQSIVSLLDFSRVEARTSIPEDMVIKKDEFTSITCTLDSFPGVELRAGVKEIGKKTSSANQSYPLVATLDLPKDIELQPGMSASLHITFNKQTKYLNGYSVPVRSVFSDDSKNSCVWLIRPETGSIHKKIVETGSMKDDSIRIIEGLNEGDQVVTTGVKFLFEGQKVRVLNKNGGLRS